jgi:3-dehydroquinate synthase
LKKFPLNVRLDGIDMTLVEECMAFDKKSANRQLRLVLLRDIGEATITADWPRDILQPAIRHAMHSLVL